MMRPKKERSQLLASNEFVVEGEDSSAVASRASR